MSNLMKDFARRAAAFCLILFCLIGYMFLFPRLYESIGKAATLLLLVVLLFVCEYLFEQMTAGARRKEER
jgi:putative flippase GtrA